VTDRIPGTMEGFDFTGEDVVAEVRRISPKVLLAFSTGKDSIGSYLAIRDAGFEDIQPYYLYQVPGNLEFIEDNLRYYEKTLFGGRHIYRMPHPFLGRALGYEFLLQPPERVATLALLDLQEFTAVDVQKQIIEELGWPENSFTANGVRAADSPIRYALFKKRGMMAAVNHSNGKFFPIFDWKKERLINTIAASGVKLPIDYRLFGKTFDGFDSRFLFPIKKHFPRDYQKILDWFPLADLEVFRYEHRNQT
jgi:hypothetical protein